MTPLYTSHDRAAIEEQLSTDSKPDVYNNNLLIDFLTSFLTSVEAQSVFNMASTTKKVQVWEDKVNGKKEANVEHSSQMHYWGRAYRDILSILSIWNSFSLLTSMSSSQIQKKTLRDAIHLATENLASHLIISLVQPKVIDKKKKKAPAAAAEEKKRQKGEEQWI